MSVLSIINARLIDPATEFDAMGTLTIEKGRIKDFGGETPPEGRIIDAEGRILAPGLIDMRVSTGEPGRESKETLASAGRAAVAGGITSMVVTPDTKPVLDQISLVEYVKRRGKQKSLVRVYISGALTHALNGQNMTELGLMSQAGAILFSNGKTPISDTLLMRRLLSYSSTFNALIANRPIDPSLSKDACAHESDLSARLGLIGAPSTAERIMAERDVALAELTGGRLLIDLISSAETVDVVKRAKSRDLDVACSVSINHLALNEIDIGDYRTFAKLDPPLRSEQDRLALLDAVNSGCIDVIVSDHDPRPAGEKRLPFQDAASGAVGLEILLAAGLTQVADGGLDLMAFLKAVTCNPADLLGLKSGRLAHGMKADLVMIDPHLPWVCQSEDLRSRSKNTPFDGRRFTGRAVMTFVGGERVFG